MPDSKRSAKRASRVPGCRLDPNVFKGTFSQYAAIGHAIERYAARHAKPLHTSLPLSIVGYLQHYFFGDHLYAASKVHFLLCYPRLRLARGASKKFSEGPVGHTQSLRI